jgi:hypothetical protein
MFITTLSGRCFTVNVLAEQVKVRDVKKVLQETENIPMENQRLVFRGMQLEDSRKVDEYDITDSSLLHLTLLLRGGGPNQSKATATNVMSIKNDTSINTVQNCFNLQHTEIGRTTVNIQNFDCEETIKIGEIFVSAEATCNQSVDISVLTKNVMDQQATSEAKSTGVALNLMNSATAESNNILELQNNIAAQVYASCSNSQDNFIGERTVNINGLRSGANCNVFNIGLSAQMGCTNSAVLDLTTDNDISQSASAKATSGADLGQLIILLLLIFGGGFFFSLLGIMMKVVLKGSAAGPPGGLGGKSTEPSISSLQIKLGALQRKVAARAAKAARDAAKEAAVAAAPLPAPPPPTFVDGRELVVVPPPVRPR